MSLALFQKQYETKVLCEEVYKSVRDFLKHKIISR